ncbi:tumor protein p63-regulated gene 1-like protein [Diadema antillarum]|uniref:tumor protein p63-regulated gene 1-like protein n=1 Tax=Diadema antillarum TaxID=105358 RepID=UPI003A8B64A3
MTTMNGNMEENLEEKTMPDVSFEGVRLTMESSNLMDENNAQGRGATTPVDNAKYQAPPSNATGFYFASQSGRLEAAATACQNTLLKPEEDGRVLGVWLLTEIDHWDNEKERVAVVAEHCLFLIKFDFITNVIKSYRKILYGTLTSIQRGNFSYPEKTLASARTGEGARLHWSSNRDVSVLDKWNPFSDSIPYITLTGHPLQSDDSRQVQSYQVGPFLNTLSQAVTTSRSQRHPNLPPVSTVEAPIQCEVYVGLSSMVFNQSKLGFFRERGGVSF